MGNRQVLTETTSFTQTSVTTYTYDTANRLTGVGGVAYTWDDRGNLRHNGTLTFTYDGGGRLVAARGVSATLVYTYNGDGLLVAKQAGSQVTTSTWDWAAELPQALRDGGVLHVPSVGQ